MVEKNNFEFELFNVHLEEHREKYFPIVATWWTDWNWPVVNPSILSTLGVIVKLNDEYICAGWLYQTDSLMCVIDFFISSKKKFADKEIRKKSLEQLIIKLEEIAKSLGFIAVYTSVRNPNLIHTLEKLEYGKDTATGTGDKNMTIFIKNI